MKRIQIVRTGGGAALEEEEQEGMCAIGKGMGSGRIGSRGRLIP
jgi:hypothetical protein